MFLSSPDPPISAIDLMPVTLHRWPANRKHCDLEVAIASRPRDHEAVYRFRHGVYVDAMGIVPLDHPFVDNGLLVDPYDAWSTQLMLFANGELAGSIRFTERRHGRLEVDDSTPLAMDTDDPDRTGEITRFMVRRDLRGTFASPALMEGIYQVMSRSPTRYVLSCGKPGYQSRLYANMFASGSVSSKTFFHQLVNQELVLIQADLGEVDSLRRLMWEAHRQLAHLIVRRSPAGLAMLRRGTESSSTSNAKQSASLQFPERR